MGGILWELWWGFRGEFWGVDELLLWVEEEDGLEVGELLEELVGGMLEEFFSQLL